MCLSLFGDIVRKTFPLMHCVILVIAMFLIYFTHSKLNTGMSKLGPPLSSQLLPTAQSVRLVSLGFDQVLADFYWLEFVGYVGDTTQRRVDRYALADQYLELITGLDPTFVQAYWFVAFIIGSEQERPQRADELLNRGIDANRDNWILPFIAGNNQYLYANDGVAAARYYRMAAKFPGAPEWLGRQANILESNAPQLIKHAYSWLSIFNSAEQSLVKERAREQCIKLWIGVFKTAPNDVYRSRARETLKQCGVDVDQVFSSRNKAPNVVHTH